MSVNEVPKNPMARAAKMARLPIGLAGRTALGVGKRIGGRSAEVVAQEIQQRTRLMATLADNIRFEFYVARNKSR